MMATEWRVSLATLTCSPPRTLGSGFQSHRPCGPASCVGSSAPVLCHLPGSARPIKRGSPATRTARGLPLSFVVTVTSLPFCLPRLPAPLANVPRWESPSAPRPTQSRCTQSIEQHARRKPQAESTLRALHGAVPSRASENSFNLCFPSRATSTTQTTWWALWSHPGPAPPYSTLDPPSSSRGTYPLIFPVPDEPVKTPSPRRRQPATTVTTCWSS